MADKALFIIKEAEAKALASVENAREEAERIIARAEKETADALLGLSDECERKVLGIKREAEINAGKKSEEYLAQTELLCSALKEKLSVQKQKAVDAVMQIITA